MRPRKLIIEAFGPFYKETVIDFDKMGNGVFLIAGDTGAGKTSIFDAMMFALYLKASGNGRSDLAHEEIYNNLAKKESKRRAMRVEFSFACKGHEYIIKRKIKWGQTGKAKKMETPESVLFCDGEQIKEDNKKGTANKLDSVTQYVIEEILCLNALQFRQIIMLAQGEFQRFLEAKSDERGEILGKLYDNRRQKDMEERLRSLALYLKTEVGKLAEKEDIKFNEMDFEDCAMEQFVCDERFKVQHPEFIHLLDEMIKKMDFLAEELRGKKEKAEKEKENLNNKRALAVQSNAIIENLHNKEKEAEELQKKEPQYKNLAEKLRLGEAAEKAIHFEENAKKTADDCGKTEKSLRELNVEIESAKIDEKQKNSIAEKIKNEYEPKIIAANNKISELEKLYPQYEALEKSLMAIKGQQSLKKFTENKFEKAKKAIEENDRAIKEQQEKLAKLSNAGEAAVKLANDKRENLLEKYNELKSLKDKADELGKLQEDIYGKENSLLAQREKTQTVLETYTVLNKSFLAGQAAILAKELKAEVEQKGEATCPVCGTIHHTAGTIAFAEEIRGNVPTQENVDEALKNWQKEYNIENDLKMELETKKTTAENNLKVILDEAEKLTGSRDKEKITKTKLLTEAIEECRQQGILARKELNKANEDFEAKKEAEGEKERLEAAAEGLKAEFDNADKEKRAAENKLIEINAQLKAQQDALKDCPQDRDAAGKEVHRLKEEAEQYRKKVDTAQAEWKRASEKIADLNGRLTELNGTLQKQQADRDKAEKDFLAALKNNNFAGEEAYRLAMMPEGRVFIAGELENWIKKTREDIAEYKGKCDSIKGALEEAKIAAQGKAEIDIVQLDKELKAAEEEYRRSDETFNRLFNKAEQNRKRFEEIKKFRSERRKYEQAEAKVKPLADVATGGNKLPFDRYVLNDFFESIIDRANSHLVRMNDGMYCLCVYQDSTGTKKEEALNLGIHYAISEQPNKCAALSGGQKFEASLALAIGLSDVVQLNSTSAINIDSMFIDEGFGSLDDIKLDRALNVLQGLSDGKRQIGIISHVDRLEECLTKKIRVSTDKTGSQIDYETE